MFDYLRVLDSDLLTDFSLLCLLTVARTMVSSGKAVKVYPGAGVAKIKSMGHIKESNFERPYYKPDGITAFCFL